MAGWAQVYSENVICMGEVKQSGSLRRSGSRRDILALGPAGTLYALQEEGRRAVPVVQHILELAAASGLRWPPDSSPQSVYVFAQGVIDFAREARRFRTDDGCGLVGGKSPQDSYNVKSFCRAVLLKLEGVLACRSRASWTGRQTRRAT